LWESEKVKELLHRSASTRRCKGTLYPTRSNPNLYACDKCLQLVDGSLVEREKQRIQELLKGGNEMGKDELIRPAAFAKEVGIKPQVVFGWLRSNRVKSAAKDEAGKNVASKAELLEILANIKPRAKKEAATDLSEDVTEVS